MVRGTIGIFLRTLANDYQDALRKDCIEAGERFGLKVEVHTAADDSDQQLAQIEEALRKPSHITPGMTKLITIPINIPVATTTMKPLFITLSTSRLGTIVDN